MDISKEQYEAAKKIVEEYERLEMMQGYLEAEEDDGYDDRDWEEEEAEREYEEKAERAATCKCGAWVFNKNGNPVHVADCFCGAE